MARTRSIGSRFDSRPLRSLTSWSAKSVGNIKLKLVIAREIILRFDATQKDRQLSPHESSYTNSSRSHILALRPWNEPSPANVPGSHGSKMET